MSYLTALPLDQYTLNELIERQSPKSSAKQESPTPAPLCECGHDRARHRNAWSPSWCHDCDCRDYAGLSDEYQKGYLAGYAKAIETVRARLAELMEAK